MYLFYLCLCCRGILYIAHIALYIASAEKDVYVHTRINFILMKYHVKNTCTPIIQLSLIGGWRWGREITRRIHRRIHKSAEQSIYKSIRSYIPNGTHKAFAQASTKAFTQAFV